MLKFNISKPEIKVTGKSVTNLEATKTEALVLLIQNTSKLSKEVSKLVSTSELSYIALPL